MYFESLLDGVFGLTHIEFVASCTFYAVDEIVAVTGDVGFGGVFPPCGEAKESTRLV